MFRECPRCRSTGIERETALSRTIERIDAIIDRRYYNCPDCGIRIRVDDETSTLDIANQPTGGAIKQPFRDERPLTSPSD